MARTVPYATGPHEVADGVWTYLQPEGGNGGRSDAGLITSSDDDTSLLADTARNVSGRRRPATNSR